MGKIVSGFCRRGRFQSSGVCYGFAVLLLLAVLAGCANAAGPDGNGNGPSTGNTFIQFDNSQGMFPVSVYGSPDRQGDSKIADLNALGISGPMAWIPQSSGASFYFSYTVSIQNVQLIFVPPGDKGVVAPRIDEGKTTIISFPALDQVVDNKDDPLCSESYVVIKNQGAYTFRLQQGNTVIERDDYPASLVNAGETGVYKLKAGDASAYSLLINATSLSLPVTVLEAGRLYSLQFNGTVLALLEDRPITVAQALSIVPPENISAASLPDGSISLTWDRAGTETGYVIYRADSETGTYTSIGNTAVTSYIDTTVAVGNIYYYRVSSVKNNVEGGKSGVAVSDDGAVRYTVTFDAAGGSPAAQTRTVVDGGIVGTLNMPSEPARNNYTFGGWYTERNGGGDKFNVDTFITGNITIYAKWTVIQYTVTFDADGGNPTGEQKTVNSGAWVGTPNMPAAPAKAGNIFGGWYTAKNGGGSQFYVDTVVTGSITVYAKWTLDLGIQYTVTFDADGGSPSVQTLTVTNGGFAGSGMPADPAKDGSVFGGWYTAVNGGGTPFTAETTVTGDDITVYARWTVQHTVTFDADYGNAATQTLAVLDGNSVGVSNMPSDPARTHYTFGGWYTAANGGGTEFTASTAVTANITVYAKWTIIRYTVTFNADGGNPAVQAESVDYGSSVGSSNMPSNPTRVLYVFGGWYTAANGGGTEFTGATTVSGNITVYAKWTAQYTVTFDADGGSPATQTKTVNSGSAVGSSNMPSNPARNGYTFGGWYTAANGGGTQFTGTTTVSGNITVYAKWTAQYTVTFSAYGGSPATQTRKVTSGSSVGSANMPSNPTQSGCTFGGWYTATNGGGTQFTSYTTVTGDITIYARWTVTITYNANGASGTPPTAQTITAGSSVSLSGQGNLTYSGHTFCGWSNSATDTGGYSAGTSYTFYSNTNLYAVWTYTVAFDADGGSPTTQTRTVNGGSSVGFGNMPLYPTRSDYAFGGWYTARNGGGTQFTYGTAVIGDITVYAKWTATTVIPGNLSLSASLSWISANAVDGGVYAIPLSANETISPTTLSYGGKQVHIVLSGNMAEKTVSLSGAGSLFTLENGVTLTLDNNVTLQGWDGNTSYLVRVRSGGTLVMNAGSKVSGNTGGGVYVTGTGANFIMSGGTISDNTAEGGAGVGISTYGRFTMSGGTISNNFGSAINSYGGGVSVDGGLNGSYPSAFAMSGGTISGNTAVNGGGVCVSGRFTTFIMSGGTISGNTSTSRGGGVCVLLSTFVKQASGTIYGSNESDSALRNTATSGDNYGHAIYVLDGSSAKKRNTTAGSGITLDSTKDGAAGGWD